MSQAMRRVLAVAMVPVLWAGCILPIGPEDLRLALSRSSGMKLQQEIGLSVDGLTLTVVGGLAGVPIPLHHLLWADVGIYRVTNPRGEEGTGDSFVMPELRGWKRFVRMRENDEDVQLYVRESGDAIHGMVVIVRDEDEVVIVRLRGRLHAFLEEVMKRTVPGQGWGGMARLFSDESEEAGESEPVGSDVDS